MYIHIYIYGVICEFLCPDSDEKRFHCVFTRLGLISSSAPTNLKHEKKCEITNIHQNLAHVASARGSFGSSCWSYWKQSVLTQSAWILCLV